jgi:hypothetical protein
MDPRDALPCCIHLMHVEKRNPVTKPESIRPWSLREIRAMQGRTARVVNGKPEKDRGGAGTQRSGTKY